MRVDKRSGKIHLDQAEEDYLANEALMADVNLNNLSARDLTDPDGKYRMTVQEAEATLSDARRWAQDVDIYQSIARGRVVNGPPTTINTR